MSRNLIRILVSTTIVSSLFALQGCNAWKGFGKDVEDTGKSIQGDKSSDSDDASDAPEDENGG